MSKSILVSFQPDSQAIAFSATVSYDIELTDNIQTLTCQVMQSGSAIPSGIQLRKFAIKSRVIKGRHTPLYNEDTIVHHLDTALFIDKVYATIAGIEKMKTAD